MSSIYQCINQRADAIKAVHWQQYHPLTAFQLTDYDAAGDDETDEPRVIVLGISADSTPDSRSTRRSTRSYKQFRVIKRPTEVRAIMHANGVPMLDDDYEVIPLQPVEQLRWCIICKDRHPVDSFVHSNRYLNGLSYACTTSLRHGWRGHRWRMNA